MTLDEKNAFNDKWLKGWTDKDAELVASMYAEDCSYWDSNSKDLNGRAALKGYLDQMFAMVPDWEYKPDMLWATDDGYCARWFLTMGDSLIRGFDFVQIRDGLISHNEVYTHEV